jgi:excisionase family DNA binding protein
MVFLTEAATTFEHQHQRRERVCGAVGQWYAASTAAQHPPSALASIDSIQSETRDRPLPSDRRTLADLLLNSGDEDMSKRRRRQDRSKRNVFFALTPIPRSSEMYDTRSWQHDHPRRQWNSWGMADNSIGHAPSFYTVREAAKIMRCNVSTLYRAIREDAFPAVKVRTRYVVPAQAINELIERAGASDGCVDVAKLTAQRRTGREIERLNRK